MFYKMRGKTIESTEYFFRHGVDCAALLKITFTDGTTAIVEAYKAEGDHEPYAAIRTL